MLTSEEIEKIRQSGKIAAHVRRLAHQLVREGMQVIDICEKLENEIRAKGGQPAFPCNVSINEVAAHYTSPPNDTVAIPPNSIVKIDTGVHIDGYISDTATSICFNPELEGLKQAVEDGLRRAIETMKPGTKVSAVGRSIQAEIEKFGYQPIKNLTGHSISRFVVHSGKHIPNVETQDHLRISNGDLFAIEPFATIKQGGGAVIDGNPGNIYRLVKDKPPKRSDLQELFEELRSEFKGLPFALRWAKRFSKVQDFHSAWSALIKERYVYSYPVLVERKGQPVSQAEHTVLVQSDGCEVITR